MYLCDETATHYTYLSGGFRPHSRIASVTLGAWLAPDKRVPMQIPSDKECGPLRAGQDFQFEIHFLFQSFPKETKTMHDPEGIPLRLGTDGVQIHFSCVIWGRGWCTVTLVWGWVLQKRADGLCRGRLTVSGGGVVYSLAARKRRPLYSLAGITLGRGGNFRTVRRWGLWSGLLRQSLQLELFWEASMRSEGGSPANWTACLSRPEI